MHVQRRVAVEAEEVFLQDQPAVIRSAGVVEMCDDSDSLMMASQADEALYRAKDAGRNRVQAARTSKQSATFSSESTHSVITL